MFAVLAVLALAAGAQAQFGPCKADGSYHLSCYTKAITPVAASAAKTQCFNSWKKKAPQCTVSIGSTYTKSYGCDTAITYYFSSQVCRELYQGQEKTNPECTLYNKNGLGDKTKRQTAKVTPDYACPPYGPCPKNGPLGSYHLSCYAKAVTAAEATASKNECFKAWKQPACAAKVVQTYANSYGCDTAIIYSFANDTCLASYQGQEKTNSACKLYNSNGLGAKANRQTAKVTSDYTCPNAGPCLAAGSYHLSCYTKKITSDNAILAKTDCFKAWNQPKCKPAVQQTLTGLFGCDTAIIYSFATDACRASYQSQEKTNKKCKVYTSLGLGNTANRMSTTQAADYGCKGPFRRMSF